MSRDKCIGKVTATENRPTTCTTVYFWLRHDVIIRPFDILRVEHISRRNSQAKSYSYAIVKELSYITDSPGHLANYISSDFGEVSVNPLNERLGTTIAEADILGNNQGIEMPIRDGEKVEWAGPEEIRAALGIDRLERPVPAGYVETSNGEEIPIDFEARYLLGPEAAHVNISGISGLASKTSYAVFLLSSIQQKMSDEVSIILFNVKGADLLSIDQPNEGITSGQIADWGKCGLLPEPLTNVAYLYPYSKRPPNFTSSHIPTDVLQHQIEENKAYNYYYDVETFKGGENEGDSETSREKMSLLISDQDDPNATMESCIHALGTIDAEDWESLRREIKGKTESGRGDKNIPVQSWRKFSRLIETRTAHDIFTGPYVRPDRRPMPIFRAIKKLRAGQVLVIDIANIPDYLQCLVVGDVIRTVFDAKLNLYPDVSPDTMGKVVIFADELNKYAPATRGSREKTLTRWLLEITERGRSLGVVLFGAEQFRSDVHDRLIGNCGTNVYGRTNPIEVTKAADYKQSFSQSNKGTVTRLAQGNVLLQHAVFHTALINVKFPFPAYRQLTG